MRPFYIVENLVQGSETWLAWRKRVIGASDAPTIMGENPWESAGHLSSEKLGLSRPFAGNAATREGQKLEPEARSAISTKFGVSIRPIVIQDGEIPYVAASLDGLTTENDQVFEIKCGKKAYERTRSRREVPSYYMAQLQHMLMVTGHKSLVFAVYRPGQQLIHLDVFRNESYITRLRRTEVEFMEQLKRRGHKAQDSFVGRVCHSSPSTNSLGSESVHEIELGLWFRRPND